MKLNCYWSSDFFSSDLVANSRVGQRSPYLFSGHNVLHLLHNVTHWFDNVTPLLLGLNVNESRTFRTLQSYKGANSRVGQRVTFAYLQFVFLIQQLLKLQFLCKVDCKVEVHFPETGPLLQ